mmetsp:Transcript_66963/g.149413  ORF Transcript_66963/g.149413 Transcript_66963/m.149413 type:complete len:209 (-) Transcript_66963:1272-1898(-)
MLPCLWPDPCAACASEGCMHRQMLHCSIHFQENLGTSASCTASQRSPNHAQSRPITAPTALSVIVARQLTQWAEDRLLHRLAHRASLHNLLDGVVRNVLLVNPADGAKPSDGHPPPFLLHGRIPLCGGLHARAECGACVDEQVREECLFLAPCAIHPLLHPVDCRVRNHPLAIVVQHVDIPVPPPAFLPQGHGSAPLQLDRHLCRGGH